ncbi:hypothetical protein Tco_0815876 [Tanacetum coccineum]
MNSGHISSGLDLTYVPSTITSQKPIERDLKLLFEAMYDDYMGGQQSDAIRTALVAPATLNPHTPNASTTTAETAPTPTNSSTKAPTILNTSHDVDEIQQHQQHFQQQNDQPQLQSEAVANNARNAIFDENMFINPFAPPSTSSDESSSQYVDPTMEPRNVKEVMTDAGLIEAIKDELLQFKWLDVWELVPNLKNIQPLTLKWLFKNKVDEE